MNNGKCINDWTKEELEQRIHDGCETFNDLADPPPPEGWIHTACCRLYGRGQCRNGCLKYGANVESIAVLQAKETARGLRNTPSWKGGYPDGNVIVVTLDEINDECTPPRTTTR